MPDTQRLAEMVEAFERRVPFNSLLGLQGFRVEDGMTRVRVPMRDELVGNFERRTLHGGVISATLDLVGGIAALFGTAGMRVPETEAEGLEIFANLGTIDLRVDYLRPGIGEWFDASASIIRTGRRVVVTRMEMESDAAKLIAVGTGTHIVGR